MLSRGVALPLVLLTLLQHRTSSTNSDDDATLGAGLLTHQHDARPPPAEGCAGR